MSAPKIGCLIPIRLQSERLPGKALMPVLGKPMVCHLLDRVFATTCIKDRRDVVVCTTTDASDDPLVAVVEGYGASVFRGSRDDIIHRFHAAVEAFGFDIILQVDGDDILCDAEYMDGVVQALLDDPEADVALAQGLPLGIASKAFTGRAMRKVFSIYRTERNDTGFAYFFTKTGLFKIATIGPRDAGHVHDTARLTLDYDADFQYFKAVIEALNKPGRVFGLGEIVQLMKDRPDILAINQGLDEEYWQRTRDKAVLTYTDEAGQERRIDV